MVNVPSWDTFDDMSMKGYFVGVIRSLDIDIDAMDLGKGFFTGDCDDQRMFADETIELECL
jgi:hypothetical protein